ncbi:MAG: DUF368 domain-containing protein [Myxococcota bacterium]
MIAWLIHSLRGMCMGFADVIPGVSGGTLALILGIYERFVAAVSAIGPGMLRAVFSRELWVRMAAGLRTPGAQGDDEVGRYAGHVLFLAFLGAGIVVALAIGARFLPTLLGRYPAQMKGFFFGLVLASVVIPFGMMRKRGAAQFLAVALFAAGTWIFVGLQLDTAQRAHGEVVVDMGGPAEEARSLNQQGVVFMTSLHGGDSAKREIAFGPAHDVVIEPGQEEIRVPVVSRMAGRVANLPAGSLVVMDGGPESATVRQPEPTDGGADPSLAFVFLAGCVAISAMVLPGISGSFILLMFGLYHYVAFSGRSFIYDQDMSVLPVVATFGIALLVGIALFSRALNWLLEHAHDTTMAALVGLMLGSLRKIWPFTTTKAAGATENVLPSAFDTTTGMTLVTFACGVAVVVLLERAGRTARAATRS